MERVKRLEPTTLFHSRLAICWQIRNPYLRDVIYKYVIYPDFKTPSSEGSDPAYSQTLNSQMWTVKLAVIFSFFIFVVLVTVPICLICS
jgi:hypothetical protein